MPMDLIAPKLDVIGSAKLVASMGIATLQCCCITKQIITGQMGIPLECSACKKVWFVQATMKVIVQEVLADLAKQRALNG